VDGPRRRHELPFHPERIGPLSSDVEGCPRGIGGSPFGADRLGFDHSCGDAMVSSNRRSSPVPVQTSRVPKLRIPAIVNAAIASS
jgi:hypothetical protein